MFFQVNQNRTLDLLILKTLSRHGEMHGYEVAESILHTSGDVIAVEESSLYPALQRMEAERVRKALKPQGDAQEFPRIPRAWENVPRKSPSISFTGNGRHGFYRSFSMDRRAWANCGGCSPRRPRKCSRSTSANWKGMVSSFGRI